MGPATSAGISVFIFAFTTIAVTLFNVSSFIVADPRDLLIMAQIVIWTVPGVNLGAQLGGPVSRRINRRTALMTLPVPFAAVGISTLLNALS